MQSPLYICNGAFGKASYKLATLGRLVADLKTLKIRPSAGSSVNLILRLSCHGLLEGVLDGWTLLLSFITVIILTQTA